MAFAGVSGGEGRDGLSDDEGENAEVAESSHGNDHSGSGLRPDSRAPGGDGDAGGDGYQITSGREAP